MVRLAFPAVISLICAHGASAAGSTNTTRDSVVVFNEIHFHPAGDNDALEYIELYNQLAVDADLSNWRLDGIGFDFPEGTVIRGRDYLVIAKTPGNYPGALGPFPGSLSNSGETLRLYNNSRSFRSTGGAGPVGEVSGSLEGRRIMDEISYGDTNLWPITPDGSGSTLAKVDPSTGSAHPQNWSFSRLANGTPGAANQAVVGPAIAFNEIAGSTSPDFRIELHNFGATPVELGGMVLASSNPLHADYTLPSGNLAPGAFTSVDAATVGFTPEDNNRLFLFTPGKAQLVDAARADDQPKARHPDGTGRWLTPDQPTFGSANSFSFEGSIVINEIFYNAKGDEEWLELHNRGASTVDLTGWKLAGGISYVFPYATSIAAGGYLVVARDAASLAGKQPSANIVGDYSGRLANDGDRIVLEDALGNPADEVEYFNSGTWHAEADGGGSSLELADPDSDNRIAGAWAASDETSRTSWQTISYEGVAEDNGIGNNIFHEFLLGLLDAGELLLDDVSVIENPGGPEIEFIQNGDFEGDSIGAAPDKWRCIGTHGSHGRSVVVADPDDPGNKCLHVVATGPTEDKHNKIETTFGGGQTVVPGTPYRITFRARWLSGSNQANTRLYFDYLQRTHILDVPGVWGTPGRANSRALANAGPTLSALAHSPVVPNARQGVDVTIEATDPDGVGELTLYYSINGGTFQSTPMTAAPDGRYVGRIPGQLAACIVRFHVRARDNSGATSFYPAAGPAGGAFYKVQDGFADTSGIRHNFRIVMAESDRQFLFLNTNRMSNDHFPVTVIENETTVYYDVGLRLKASAWGRFNWNTYGFNIQFQPDHLFRGVHRSISIERSFGDNLQETLAKHLMNRAGGAYWSFYDDVAHIITPTDGDRGVGLLAMSRHTASFWDGTFPDESDPGTLFNQELLYSPTTTVDGDPEGLKPGTPWSTAGGRYDLLDRGTDKEAYRWGFQIRSARSRDDYSQLIALNQAMGNLSGAALKDALDPIIDADQWMRTFAMMGLNGTTDVYGRGSEHNFRYYVRPTDRRIIVLQWDLDKTFYLSTGAPLPPTDHNVTKLFSIPQYRRLFDGHVNDLIETCFNSTYATPWAANLTTVTGKNINGRITYINNRVITARASLPAAVTFQITTNGGAGFSEADSAIDLAGDAWIDVFSILVNGAPTAVTWTDADSWRITVPISVGANPLRLTALNNRGTEVGSDLITVTNTSAVDLAAAGSTAISELHYHPADPTPAEIAAGFTDAELFEFVELTNISTTHIDLTGVKFTDGVAFTFLAGPVLAPGARLVVVSDQAAFQFRYGAGTATIAGTYTGFFKNSGEHVRLEAADTSAIADFTYGDGIPWPTSADGAGYSLVFVGRDPAAPLDWRPSTNAGGNPGASDASAPFSGDPDRDEDGDGLSAFLEHAIGSSDASPDPATGLAIGTGLFDDGSGTLRQYLTISYRRNLAADDVVIEMQASTGLWTWSTLGTVYVSATHNGDGTETVTCRSGVPFASIPREFVRLRVFPR